jgi:hypothetical protein
MTRPLIFFALALAACNDPQEDALEADLAEANAQISELQSERH